MAESTLQKIRQFPKVYWTVQFFELMERGAYYSMMPILAVHFHWNVGLPYWLAVILTVFMYPFQYGMPIFSSALAEKVGYRKQMIIGFTVLTFAYLFLSFANNIPSAIIGVMLVGFGIGTYKPLVSSTVAKSTSQKQRNLAYSIYYWVVNFAATFFALIWAALLMSGYMAESMYAWVFRISSVFFLVNIVVAVLIFKEVPRSGDVKTIKDVNNNIKTAFADRKFVIMMFLIAGFWAMYSVTLAPFQTVMYGFHFLPENFPIILLGVFNPGTIILFGIPLANLVEKIESIKALMGGVLIYLIGFILLAFFMQVWIIAILAIIIYSVGEFMVAPGYLSFVSKLAPKEKVSAYIGCNFLASFMGIFGGAFAFGLLVDAVGARMMRPHFFLGIVIAFGFFILLGFMIYYKKWGQDIVRRSKEIEAMDRGEEYVEELEEMREDYKAPFLFRIFDHKASMVMPLILIPLVLAGTFAMGTYTFYGVGAEEELPAFSLDKLKVAAGPGNQSGNYLAEGESDVQTVSVPLEKGQLLKSIEVSLTWEDEPDFQRVGISPRTWENQPDTFRLDVSQGEVSYSEEGSNQHGSSKTITVSIEFSHQSAGSNNGTGEWTVTVTMVEAGDNVNSFSPLIYTDQGNEYDLTISTEIYTE